jgi:hypothetical protein
MGQAMLPLVFSDWTIAIVEERDYPGDPAPYLVVTLRSAPERCRCRRALPIESRTGKLEREEALELAHAIIAHYRIQDGRRDDRERMRVRVDAEYDRLAALDALRERLRGEIENI